MGTAEVGRFDRGAVVSDLAHGIDCGRARPKHFSAVKTCFALPLGIVEKHGSNNDHPGRHSLGLCPGFVNFAPTSNDVIAIIPKVISLSTGQ